MAKAIKAIKAIKAQRGGPAHKEVVSIEALPVIAIIGHQVRESGLKLAHRDSLRLIKAWYRIPPVDEEAHGHGADEHANESLEVAHLDA